MQTFNEIIDKLKQIIGSDKDKDVAIALGIKPTTFASQKRRQRIPYASIIRYCLDNRVDVDSVLQGEAVLPEIEGKVVVRYFRSLDVYRRFIGLPAKESLRNNLYIITTEEVSYNSTHREMNLYEYLFL